MKALSAFPEIFICLEAVDFRKSVDGLAAFVQGSMGKSPFSGALFVFFNRNKDRVKILYFDRTGYALWFKRLEKEKFPWPKNADKSSVALTPEELGNLLEGFDIWKWRPHKSLHFLNAE